MVSKYEACEILLTTCSGCEKDENILFVTDPTSYDVAMEMWNAAKDYPNKSMVIMDERTMHGEEPTKTVAGAMLEADVIFGITTFSLFHSNARKEACKRGARFINMVDYSLDMLKEGGLYVDFDRQGEICKRVSELIEGDEIVITTDLGTDFAAKITNRPSVPQYGRSLERGTASSPPDIECAIGAVEGTANGIVYIDGSIPHPELGLISEKIKLTIKDSKIVDIEGGEEAEKLKKVLKNFGDPNVYIVGEIGLGLNPKCKLSGRMLEDEGTMGTVHLGLGDSTSFHGITKSKYHLDVILKDPTVMVDGKVILEKGKLGFEI